MAEKPIKTPLPADLPEDWNIGQTVAPDGTSVGLTEQHGYNYLMAAVNRAQRGVNEVNEAFETVSGKRTCRFVVGTSTAGWTEADCDYLCDGVDDQVEIQAAIKALPAGGGEIVLLDGTYQLSAGISAPENLEFLSLVGNSKSTVITGSSVRSQSTSLSIKNCTLKNTNIQFYATSESVKPSFFFEGNTVTSNDSKPPIDMYGGILGCVISDNTIECNAMPAIIDIVNPFVFFGNTIRATGDGVVFNPNPPGNIVGNIFYNCSALVSNSSAITGNSFFGCDIEAGNGLPPERCPVISGNTVLNGTIKVSGNVIVEGNSVIIEASSGVANAIYSQKALNNYYADRAPQIVGNYLSGEHAGSSLMIRRPTIQTRIAPTR